MVKYSPSLHPGRDADPALYTYRMPFAADDGLPTASLGQVGMDTLWMSNLVNCIYANQFDQVDSVLVWRKDRLVFTEGNYVVKKHIHRMVEDYIRKALEFNDLNG